MNPSSRALFTHSPTQKDRFDLATRPHISLGDEPKICYSLCQGEEPPEDELATWITSQLTEVLDLIRSYAELVYERHAGYLEPEGCRHLRLIIRSCDRAEILAELLREYCQASQPVEADRRVKLSDLLDALRKDFCCKPGEGLRLHVQPDMPELSGDPELFQRLFILLVDLISTSQGGKSSHIEVRAENATTIFIHVVDTGDGSHPQQETSAHRLSARKGAPTLPAIKLAIARRMMRSLGGQLRVVLDGLGRLGFQLQFESAPQSPTGQSPLPPPHWASADNTVNENEPALVDPSAINGTAEGSD